MKQKPSLIGTLLVLASLLSVNVSFARSSRFYYQGQLTAGGAPANGSFDLRFSLYDSTNGPGTPVAGPVTLTAVLVTNGLVTAPVDFDDTFAGQSRWLEIAVSANGANAFATLAPRQRLEWSPAAIFASAASNLLGQVAATNLTGTVPIAILPASLLTNGAANVSLTGTFSGNGAGLTNLNLSGVALLGANQTFSGANTFTQPLILSSGAPLLRLLGQSSTATLDLSTYDPGTNPPSARIQARDNNWGSDVDFYTKQPGGNSTLLVSRLRLSANGNVGIGAANPSAPLEVAGSALFDTNVTVTGTIAGNGAGLTNVPGALCWQRVTSTSVQAQANSGYLIDNNDLTTLTLPNSPALGDTIRVMEAGGGAWRIAQNADQRIALGNASAPDQGLLWTNLASSNRWVAVAVSADGTKWLAAMNPGYLATSADSGRSWLYQSHSASWESVASSADGCRLVAVAQGGRIWTSTDSGLTWTAQASNQQWKTVASSADGARLIAGVYGGNLWTSTDAGVTWSSRGASNTWISTASSADGVKLVAAAYNGNVWTSADGGVTWTSRAGIRMWQAVASSSDGVKLAAGAYNGGLWTSSDSGVTWTNRTSNQIWTAVASSADGSKWIAAASPGNLWISTDSGVTWTSRASLQNWSAVAMSAQGNTLLGAVNSSLTGTEGGCLWGSTATTPATTTTTTGTSGYLSGDQDAAITLKYVGDGLWKPLSHEGYLYAH